MEESPPQNTNSEITDKMRQTDKYLVPLEAAQPRQTPSKNGCPFCHRQNIEQTLLEHTLNCAEYEKVLDETTCPLCHIEIDGSMTLHLFEHIKKKETTSIISNPGN
jgi:hypothetical protein